MVARIQRNLPGARYARIKAARGAAAARLVARRRARLRLVVVVPGAGHSRAVVEARPSRFKLDRAVLLLRAAGWSVARIAREYGVGRPAVWKWLKRRRAGAVAMRQPGWVWRQCSTCKAVGWFRQTSTRKAHQGRVFCSLACYRSRGSRKTTGRGASSPKAPRTRTGPPSLTVLPAARRS